ncbi:MAG TPA: CPBP family intramembrane glutamic endopeptidase [Terriglobia bacterium]|nr:CPBP family intramembrane glutamic endopeptidase [Terriglobia bacterium]
MNVFLIAAYVVAPFLLLRLHRFWGVPLAVLSLWIPVEAGLLARLGLSPTIVVLLAVSAGLLAFYSRPDVLDVPKAFDLSSIDVKSGVIHFLAFAVIAIPLGLILNFIHLNFDAAEVWGVPATVGVIFLFNALPEEILFRGLIQNWIEKQSASRSGSLLLSSLIFGASHLNNGAPLPNYRYMVMASIAGVFYGLAWRSRKNVLTSSITHTLVNTGWNLFFR